MPAPQKIALSEKTAYFASASNVGLFQGPRGTVLIDSGNDAESGRKLLQALKAEDRTLAAVVLTHSNADHMGGAAFLASRTGAPIYSSRMEAAFCADPVLEPSFLWGGCPPPELRGKFFMAPACTARRLEDEPQLPEALAGMSVIDLPGHYFGQRGFLAEDVLFAGDALFGPESIAKHPLFFVYDFAAFLASLDRIQALAPRIVLPSHGRPTEDVTGICAANRTALQETVLAVRDACAAGGTADDILAGVADRYHIALDWAQYGLIGSTVRSCLVYLRERGELSADFEEGHLVWRRK